MQAGVNVVKFRYQGSEQARPLLIDALEQQQWPGEDESRVVILRRIEVAGRWWHLPEAAGDTACRAEQSAVSGWHSTADTADAVVFETGGDLLACQCADVLQGNPARWFWQHWPQMTETPARALGSLLHENFEWLPDALARLEQRGLLPALLTALRPAVLVELAERSRRRFGEVPGPELPTREVPAVGEPNRIDMSLLSPAVAKALRRWAPVLGRLPAVSRPAAAYLAATLTAWRYAPERLGGPGSVQNLAGWMRCLQDMVDGDRPAGATGPDAAHRAASGRDAPDIRSASSPVEARPNPAAPLPDDAISGASTRPGRSQPQDLSVDKAGENDGGVVPFDNAKAAPETGVSEENSVDPAAGRTPLSTERAASGAGLHEAGYRTPEDAQAAAGVDSAAIRFLTRTGGIFFLLNAMRFGGLDKTFLRHGVSGWHGLWRIAAALGLSADRALRHFIATRLALEEAAELDALPRLADEPEWVDSLHRHFRHHAFWADPAWVRMPARVIATPTHLDVHFHQDAANPEIRIAGLDINPGWFPWFGMVMNFHYGPYPELQPGLPDEEVADG